MSPEPNEIRKQNKRKKILTSVIRSSVDNGNE